MVISFIILPIRMHELITRYALGCLIAWMVSSNAKEATIGFFLTTLRQANPTVIMSIMMTDFDWAQINMIMVHYPKAQIFLCWWHVLHAWQQHITISHYPELWKLLKQWVCITDTTKFAKFWVDIKALAPVSFLKYLNTYWLTPEVKPMWSAQERTHHMIFQLSNTNILVEA